MSDVSVCAGGPWDGRVYFDEDLAARQRAFERVGQGEPFEYERTGEFVGVGHGKRASSARVWRHRPVPRPPRAPEPIRCTYRGCEEPPTRRLSQSIGGRPWLGCDVHWKGMHDALLGGMPGATSGGAWVDVVTLEVAP